MTFRDNIPQLVRSIFLAPSFQGALLFIAFFAVAGALNPGWAFCLSVVLSLILNLSSRAQGEVTIGVLMTLVFCSLIGLVLFPRSMLFATPLVLLPFIVSYVSGWFFARVFLRVLASRI